MPLLVTRVATVSLILNPYSGARARMPAKPQRTGSRPAKAASYMYMYMCMYNMYMHM